MNKQRFALTLALVLVGLFASGCSDDRREMSDKQIAVWIPAAATKAIPGAFESTPSLATTSIVTKGLLVGPPRAAYKSRWTMWLPGASSAISQDLLLKTADGRYFAASYVWRNDPVLDDSCRRDPARCAKFEGQQQLSEEAMMATLNSPQVKPADARAFVGQQPPMPGQ